ncbi:MAG: bacteriophage holin [Candidatus Nanohaloarchaea archaeon]
MTELDTKAVAFSAGALWGGAMLLLGWLAAFAGAGTALVQAFGSIYIGFAPTAVGGVIGGVYGFIDMAIGGYLFASIYNWAEGRF